MISTATGWFIRYVLRSLGKDYTPAVDLPVTLMLHVIRVRLTYLIRGLVRVRSCVFLGPGVKLRGKSSITLGRASTLEAGVSLDGYARDGVMIGARTRIGAHTIVSCTSHLSLYGQGLLIGADSGIAEFGYIGCAGGVIIGDNVIMGQFVTFHAQEHTFDQIDTLIRRQASTERGIVIADDCWIGAKVTFLDGAHVGEGCVVAAGAVVKGSFPPQSVIGGIPARVIRTRATVAMTAEPPSC